MSKDMKVKELALQIPEKRHSHRRTNQCKYPKAGACFAWSNYSKEVSAAEVECEHKKQ